jgi:hypothetical protein
MGVAVTATPMGRALTTGSGSWGTAWNDTPGTARTRAVAISDDLRGSSQVVDRIRLDLL